MGDISFGGSAVTLQNEGGRIRGRCDEYRVGGAYIVDGRLPNALLLKLFTHTGLGTEVAL